ncbi:hypothetical protein PENTCL1PPCAC_8643 [Pristionchus entomophagus]|uniref:Protein kinase domain-containing protein n=1 Tax=Pristionchus entomophagus TaxID=358040 RepID=A0AAV5SWS8_9BILA|nr:hypothetical protein PENTCL1PPCAC_8643 [Pristionchus entomophagus]
MDANENLDEENIKLSLPSNHQPDPDDGEGFYSIFQKHFKPIKLLGQGSFGCVFEAEISVDGEKRKEWTVDHPLEKVAVKRIPFRFSVSNISTIMNEVLSHKQLKHKGIVWCHDFWTEIPPIGWQKWADGELLNEINTNVKFLYEDESSFLYIMMKRCDLSLADWLIDNTSRDLKIVKIIFSQLVYAVMYIHEKKLMHRDLKPSNILFSRNGSVKICDLGIASVRVINCEDRKGQEVAIERTMDQGTVLYMAPEQPGYREYSSKVDIFALGLILAEMCVVITDEEREEIFDNYRCGRPNGILKNIPEAENFVSWLTNPIDTERPAASRLHTHEFLRFSQSRQEIKQIRERKRIKKEMDNRRSFVKAVTPWMDDPLPPPNLPVNHRLPNRTKVFFNPTTA